MFCAGGGSQGVRVQSEADLRVTIEDVTAICIAQFRGFARMRSPVVAAFTAARRAQDFSLTCAVDL